MTRTRGAKPVILNQRDQHSFNEAFAALQAAIDVGDSQCAVNRKAKEDMRLYLSSWVRGPLMPIVNKIYRAKASQS